MAVNAGTMAATDVRRAARARHWGRAPWLPALMALAVVVGLGAMLASTSIIGRGDYGQWLMTSRYYLGEPVPGYRSVPGLPPFVPVLLALVQLVVRDPIAALQVVNVGLMAGLAASIFTVGAVVGRRPLVGALSVAIGMLITDRFLEMFAFGGLLQAAAVMWTAFAIAAFTRAGREQGVRRRWWVLGSMALALVVLSHVGAGTVAVPTCLAVAGISLLRLRHLGWETMRKALVPIFIGLALIGAYWAVVLLPASGDYVTNPASLGYRGPSRLFSRLFDSWPTAMVIVIGTVTLGVGSVAELLRRSADRHVVLLTWAAAAWGSLAVAVASHSSTDYPRFAPVLLAPMVPACALAALAGARLIAVYLHRQAPRVRASAWLSICVGALVVVAIPFAVERYERQTVTYQPLDATSLAEAVAWVDGALPASDLSVLTAVRDGKWLEGMTGREALFSLPVRYAFRPSEWQRSVDAESILRSTAAMTNEFFFVKYTDQVAGPEGPEPTGLLLSVNHGGEYVEVLRIAPRDTRIASVHGTATLADLQPSGVRRTLAEREVAIRTDWHGAMGAAEVQLTQVVSLVRDGATLRMTAIASSGTPEMTLSALPSSGIRVLDISGREANICFTQIGASQPCVRIWTLQAGAVLEPSEAGGLRVRSGGSRLDLFVTARTAAGPSVGLGLLDPMQLLDAHHVGAALLVASDPAYAFRLHRLEALGFAEVHRVGPYAILVRSDLVPGQVQP